MVATEQHAQGEGTGLGVWATLGVALGKSRPLGNFVVLYEK